MTEKKANVSPVDFLEREVLPVLADRLDSVFPEFSFRPGRGGWWIAGAFPAGFEDYGTKRGGELTAREWGLRTFKQGRPPVSWTSYVFDGGKSTPRGRDFVDAVRELARRAGVDASALEREVSPAELEKREKAERKRNLLEDFLLVAREALAGKAGEKARAYLVKRGFREEDLGDLPFGLYTTADEVKDALTRRGHGLEEVRTVGLLPPAYDDGKARANLWPGRLVIAWRDSRGTIGTFAARDLTGKAEDAEKYLYLPGTSKAALVAFGLDEGLRNGGKEDLLLVEGLMDVVLLQSRGRGRVAAIGGGGEELSPERWKALADLGVRRVTLALDFDPKAGKCEAHGRTFCRTCAPGSAGTRKAVENARKVDNVPVISVVPPEALWKAAGSPEKDGGPAKVDPDEVVRRKDVAGLDEALRARTRGEVWRGSAFLEDVTPSSPEGDRREAVEAVLEFVAGLRGDRAALDEADLLRLTRERTGYELDALRETAGRLAERKRREETEKAVDAVLREADAARKEGKAAREVVRDLRSTLAALEARTETSPPPFSVDRLKAESAETPDGKPSGWATLDALDVRFNAGELALTAGRTGHAKTTFLVGLLWNWLREVEKRDEVLVFYSAEEPEVRIFHRLAVLACREAALALDAKGSSPWSASDVRAFLRAKAGSPPPFWPVAEANLRRLERSLLVVYRPSWTVEELEAHALELAGRRKVGAVLADYLQRIPPPAGSFDRRDIEVSAVARRLKSLSVALNVPVVAGAQINREAVPDKYHLTLAKKTSYEDAREEIRKARPALHHLREGGSEQEADLVLGLLNYAADFRTDAGTVDGDGMPKGPTMPETTRLEVGILKGRYTPPGRWAALALEGRLGLVREPETWEKEKL